MIQNRRFFWMSAATIGSGWLFGGCVSSPQFSEFIRSQIVLGISNTLGQLSTLAVQGALGGA
ncbi:MAG: hypothetical protein AB7N71_04465 [Phycisphaerae bacterium]